MEQGEITAKRILLADDDDGVRSTLRFLLGMDQHKVSEARNGQEALACYRRGSFDLVITDYVMPVMKGDELAANIKSLKPRQPILLITAYADQLDRANSGIDAVLGKPFSFQQLREVIKQLLSEPAVAADGKPAQPAEPRPGGDTAAPGPG